MDGSLPIDHLPGANHPPEPTPFEAVKVHLEDLTVEARNWADGTAIATQAQADEVSFLIDQLRKGVQVAEKVRKDLKRPHLDAAAAVDAPFKPFMDAADRAVTAAKATIGKWLRAEEVRKTAEATAAAEAAQVASRQAAMTRALADETDLESQEAANAATQTAEELAKGARRAAADKATATGGARAMTLRSYWTVTALSDRRETLKHYLTTAPDAVEAFLLEQARKDVARGLRTIPGVEITEERRPV